MGHNFDLDEPQKRYCIRGTHVAIICVTVVVCAVTVGLAVGLTRTDNSIPSTQAPTAEPSKPPPPERGPCLPSTNSNGDWKNFRLPDYVRPVHYDLLLEPDFNDDVYSGTVDVHLEVTKATRHLWMHIRETFVSGKPRLKKMAPGGPEDIPVNGCFEYKLHQYVVVEAAATLAVTAPGEVYVLSLDFQGSLTGSVVGFYRVVYTENGKTKKIAATDHEPTDARKSFPCFDEPNKKATYNISIINDDTYGALSNMPVQGSPVPLPEKKIRTNFEKSVPMSTYLVCFAVHQFTYVERMSLSNIPLRIYAQPSQIATAEYAANTTKIVFDYFEEYFDMKYSLPKLDKIAIPDFGTGAMENWGLITYRETNLLYDENQSSSTNKKQVAKVIAHELVHQWFGNIVTMDWWDDLWLNEGFASFFEYIGVEKAEPDWGMRDIMIIDDVLPVMVDDALLSSHPIIVDVSTPDEITAVFDAISYSKGASILRMLEDWMGRDLFRDGCRKYLKDYTFKNAKTANFWASLNNVSALPVAEVMDTWTKQMGYPVLNLSVSETGAKLTQKRFLLDPNATNETISPFGYKWTIPVKSYTIESKKTNLSMFDWTTSEHVVPSYSPAVDGLLKVNNDHMGFYRVNHDDLMWDTISEQLQRNLSVFAAADRASYMDDVFALSRANLIDYGNAFNLTKYLTGERDYIVWERVDASMAYVRDMLSGEEDLFPKFQALFRGHVKAVTQELGFTDVGTHTQRILRETVLDIACQMGDEDSLKEMSNMFDRWIDGTIKNIPVNLRLLVYQYGMKTSVSVEKWEIMFQRYKETSLAQEKVKLLYGLASVQNVDLLYKLLEATKDESVVRSQDLFTVVRYVSYNQLGQDMAWDWTTLNWDYLVQRYTINDRNLGRLLTQISRTYNTALQKWKMEHFFALTPNSGAGELSRKQGLETVNNNIDWISKNRNEIKRWLDSNV